jgi:carboxypeptidase Q
MAARIQQSELRHSEIMPIVHLLADTYGPRLTGSANERAADIWAAEQLRRYGLVNVHLEPWSFGHDGWVNSSATGYIVAPIRAPLTFAASAWTPGTSGVLRGSAVLIDPPAEVSAAALGSYLESVRAQLAGKIVLIGKGDPVAPDLTPQPRRWTAAALHRILDARKSSDVDLPQPGILTSNERDAQLNAFLRSAGALMRIDDSHLPHGLVAAGRNRSFDTAMALPGVTLRTEDYGRIARLLRESGQVVLEFDIHNEADPQGRTSANLIGEIPGTDLKDQVVMFGAHLDSWHVATGATDDAVGCAIMMEAARLLTELGVRPRRTLRIALWSGEEEGLLGSQDYVARHFGTTEAPKADFRALAAYINIDGGTGRIRGLNVFGPMEAGQQLAAILKPLGTQDVAGAVPHHVRRMGSTDATTFSRAGLTTIGAIQDPVDVGMGAYHSNIDTYDHVIERDARQAAAVIAYVLYALANLDKPLARFPSDSMPPALSPPPQARPVTSR